MSLDYAGGTLAPPEARKAIRSIWLASRPVEFFHACPSAAHASGIIGLNVLKSKVCSVGPEPEPGAGPLKRLLF